MDGPQLPGKIKQHFPNLPVVMVTHGDDERRRIISTRSNRSCANCQPPRID